MKAYTLNVIILMIFALPIVKFINRYILKLFIPFMLNQKNSWDGNIDKPRILFYMWYCVIFVILWIGLSVVPFSGYWLYISQMFLILLAIVFSYILFQTWRKRFKEVSIPKAIKLSQKVINETIICAINDVEIMRKIFDSIVSDNLIVGSFESFSALCLNDRISKENRLKWNHLNGDIINKKSLVQLFSNVYTNIENLSNITIASKMEEYFTDISDNELFMNIENKKNHGKVVSNWRTSTTDYSETIDIHFRFIHKPV